MLFLKFDSLLKPYFIVLISLSALHALLGNGNLGEDIGKILYGSGIELRWGPMWFLPHLFAVAIFAWLLIFLLGKVSGQTWLQVVILLLMLIVGVISMGYFWQKDVYIWGRHFLLPGLPFSVDIIFVTAFYFLIGFYGRDFFLHFKPSWALTLGALIAFISLHFFLDMTMDLNGRRYDGIVVPTIEAFSGIYLTMVIAYAIQFFSVPSRIFSFIGSATLFILIFHSHFQSKTFDLLTAYLQQESVGAGFLSLIMGLVAPILIWLVVKNIPILALFLLPIRTNKLFRQHRQLFSQSS